ncbi:hypothetical protein LCGC14_1279700 [marine sediment metagenome]|uniref:Uncharacterized protein n=1 Tax=marine sediment metagenome TaxID=412755 RepID=A0A0F9KVL1_9ZZZZ
MEEYRVTDRFLNETINHCSRQLVGLVMKRFEIFEDKDTIKASIKELIYENFRGFKALIKASSYGVKFETKKPGK